MKKHHKFLRSIEGMPTAKRALLMSGFVIVTGCGFSACSSTNQEAAQVPLIDQAQQEADAKAAAEAEAYRTAITEILRQDATMAATSQGDYTSYAAAMQKLDLTKCPRDFAVAYFDHATAWDEGAKVQRMTAELRSEGHVDGVLLTELLQLTGVLKGDAVSDHLDDAQNLSAAAIAASDKIKNTYTEVKRIAVGYGATLPGTLSTQP